MNDSILAYLQDRKESQFSLLKHLVLQPSYTKDLPGCNAVADAIIDALSGSCMQVEEHKPKANGRHLVFRSPACDKHEKSLLLVGHMDTVFPPSSGFDYFKRENGISRGPGVIDMKGGLVIAIFALKSLDAVGLLQKLPITFICNSDEETGSLSSTELIRSEALRSFAGLVFECGGLNGEVVTGRKGRTGYEVQVQGEAGHAAFAGENKASSILELAHKIIEIEKINDLEKQLVVNVGLVDGGIGPNTVPEFAKASIDTRFLTNDDCVASRKDIGDIVSNCKIVGTSAELKIVSSRPPMEQSDGNRRLFFELEALASELGIEIKEELRSGVSDANTIASCGVPVLDGLGPIGDCDHSNKEYMIENSLLERTKLTAFAIPHICNLFLEK
ncbi:MAG: M20 family metallopeptidase [Desulfotalea sp.]